QRAGLGGKGLRASSVWAGVTGVYVLLAALAVSAAVAAWYRASNGRLKSPTGDNREDLRPLIPVAGERATLLQFSSAFCAPCRATRRILGDVAAIAPGVTHVEIDAESNLELVRKLNILKTPTTLVLDERGREVVRASGQPKKADVLRALGQAVPS
ncbi:MAG: thiol reductase thioredoxin, partial [Frankiales bacterium]|nr:thiol reductase thioredoxin [Frankiales bacterium]